MFAEAVAQQIRFGCLCRLWFMFVFGQSPNQLQNRAHIVRLRRTQQ